MAGEFRERRVWTENAERYIERAKVSARKRGFYEHADDIAQTVVLRMLEGRHKHATVDQAVIDAIRIEFGDSRTSHASKRDKLNKAIRFDEGIINKFRSCDPRDELDDRLDYERMVKALSGAERVIFVLVSRFGFEYWEVGMCLGTGASAVCQRYQYIVKKLIKIFGV